MRYLLWLCFAGLACAQGTDPKAKAEDYDVHARANGVAIGAEYMVHSFSGQAQTFLAPDFLVVEVAIFPDKRHSAAIYANDFHLRVDGKRLSAATPQAVAYSLQQRDWYRPRGVQAAAGIGDKVVVLGAPPRQVPPYGHPPPTTPAPPRAPEPDDPSGLPPAATVKADELVTRTAFPEGTFAGPVSG